MSVSVDAYEDAKRKLIEAAGGKGFAESPEPERAPERLREVYRCPVHLCHPGTGESLEVAEQGQFCRRHWEKLSPPMQRQVQVSRATGDLAQLAEAIKECRAYDEHWAPWAVVHGGRIEPFERWDRCVDRWVRVREDGAVIVSGVKGQRWDAAAIANYCPTEVWSGDESGVIASSDHPNRPREQTPLQWVLGLAYQAHKQADGRPKWPRGLEPVVVNLWTDDRMSYREAVRIAGRVHA